MAEPPPPQLGTALLSVVGDFAPLAILLLDEQMQVRWMSDSARQAPPIVSADVVGRHFRDVVHHGLVTDELLEILRQGLDRRVDTVVTLGDGRQREFTAFPVDLDGQRCVGIVFVMMTAALNRLVDEHVLRESLLADAAQLGVWRLDLRDGSLVGNSWYAKVNDVGTPDAPGVLAEVADRVHPEDVDRWRATIERAVASGEPYTMKYRLLGPTGEMKVLQSRARLAPGRPHQLFGVVMDVTESELAPARQLRESMLADAAQLGMWEWDRETDRVVWNEWHERLFGYEPGTPVRTFDDWSARVHPDDVEPTSAVLAAAVEHGRLFESAYRVVLPSGEIRHLEGRGQLDPSDPMRMVGVVYDVTDRELAAEREAELQRQALQASDVERDRIAADIHDGPLQALSAAWLRLNTLASRLDGRGVADEDEELAMLARNVAASLGRTNQELRDVLGRLRSLPVDSSIDTFVNQVTDLGEELSEREGFAFRIAFDAGGRSTLPGITLATMYRIVAEAVLNAANHANPSNVEVVVQVHGARVVATVTDDGAGFDATAPGPAGHFGLSIMRQRAMGLKGTTTIRSTPGVGTTVTVSLPLDGSALDPSAPAADGQTA